MAFPKTTVTPTPAGKVPILLSYALVRDDLPTFRMFVENPKVEVLLDSGAFTALNTGEVIDLDHYMQFLTDWKDKLFGYLALDVLGDPKGTDTNLATMLRNGFAPIPVHVRGDGQARMDQLFELSSWVALGGLRRPHAGHSSQEYVKQKMLWARGRNVHWLGYTAQAMVRGFRPYSCDSSNWASGARWGLTSLYLGDWKWAHRGRPSEGGMDAPFSAEEIEFLKELEYTPEDVRDPVRWRVQNGDYRQHTPFNITAYSFVKYAREVRRLLGTRVFLAVLPIGAQFLDPLCRYIEATEP